MLPDKAKALQNTINKGIKREVAVTASTLYTDPFFTTGSLSLDIAMGGGWAANVWSELVGPYSSGKTSTLNKTLAANMKKNKHFCGLWVAGERYDKDQAAALGVDLDRLIVVNVQDTALAFEVMIEACESRGVDAIILDSYPALVTAEEKEKAMSEVTVASGARIMNRFIRKAGEASARSLDGTDSPFFGVIVNQWRDQIGGFSHYGTPKTTPGGKGRDYFFHTRLEVKRDAWIEEKRPNFTDPVKVGQTIKFHTIKNKAASPMQTASVDYYFRRAPYLGFSRGYYDLAKEYINAGIMFNVIQKGGAWLKYAGQQWQGREKMTEELRDNPALMEKLGSEVLAVAADPLKADLRTDE